MINLNAKRNVDPREYDEGTRFILTYVSFYEADYKHEVGDIVTIKKNARWNLRNETKETGMNLVDRDDAIQSEYDPALILEMELA